MIKRIGLVLILSLVAISLIGCGTNKNLNNKGNSSSIDSQFVEYDVAGYITKLSLSDKDNILGSIHVEGSKDNGAIYDNAVVTVTTNTKIYSEDTINFNSLKVGMYVNVFFVGPVKESYPIQADAKQINVIPNDPMKKGTDNN